MAKIGLFYGSDTGCTEGVANTISELLGEENVDLFDVYDVDGSEFDGYQTLILGLSTWHDGQLQSAWDDFFNNFKEIDMSGKTVASAMVLASSVWLLKKMEPRSLGNGQQRATSTTNRKLR